MCTNFKIHPADDGTVCVGRTMEFPDVIPWELAVVGTGEHRSGVGDRRWTSVHGIVGMSGFGEPTWLADGLNTAGLTGHLLYMPDHCTYADPVGDGTDIGILEVLAFVLGTCATVDEAKAAVATCNIVDQRPAQVPFSLPMHIVLHDGETCAVVELHPEGMRIVDNPVQVVTNAPYLEWHLTNVSNYLNLSPSNPQPVEIGGTTFVPTGQGEGFRGLPADESSPSRFLRVLANVTFATPSADRQAALLDTIRILHGFDLVPGTVMESTPAGPAPLLTMWSTVADLTGGAYLYNTIADPVWYSIDLASTDFSSSRSVPLAKDGAFTPLTI